MGGQPVVAGPIPRRYTDLPNGESDRRERAEREPAATGGSFRGTRPALRSPVEHHRTLLRSSVECELAGVETVDKQEAKRLLAKELEWWRQRPYVELASFVGQEPVTGEVQGAAGTSYQYEIQVFWDGKAGGNVRVVGAIDDGGIRAFLPLTDDFIMATDGNFVGEDLV